MQRKGKPLYLISDLLFSLEQAAEFLDMEEWPGEDAEAQMAANQEAALRIRRMANRLAAKNGMRPVRAAKPLSKD